LKACTIVNFKPELLQLWKRVFLMENFKRKQKQFSVHRHFNSHRAKTNKQSALRATTAQLYPGRDSEFDKGQVTKNQPITELILPSESLAI